MCKGTSQASLYNHHSITTTMRPPTEAPGGPHEGTHWDPHWGHHGPPKRLRGPGTRIRRLRSMGVLRKRLQDSRPPKRLRGSGRRIRRLDAFWASTHFGSRHFGSRHFGSNCNIHDFTNGTGSVKNGDVFRRNGAGSSNGIGNPNIQP